MELSTVDNRNMREPYGIERDWTYSILYVMAGVAMSLYFFSFEFTFLPGLNTKMMLAVAGVAVYGINSIRNREISFRKELLPAVILAVAFSVAGFVSMDINQSADTTYALYFMSFATWLGAGYAVCQFIKAIHGAVNFKLLTYYLAAVCVGQCVLALVIDNNPAFQALVNSYVEQDQAFLMDVNRLYGIGASLDNAGVRFSVVLVLIAALLCHNSSVLANRSTIFLLITAFVVIVIMGNIISRTTIVGTGLGLFYLLWQSGVISLVVKERSIKLATILIALAIVGTGVAVYFYQSNPVFQSYMRFAFEGFFNWVEKGEWRTDSTDRLNTVMWIWPDPADWRTWLIGKATFDDWHAVGTDIGYCRFIFYNGLIGLSIFSLFFVYNAWVCRNNLAAYRYLYLFLLALTFIVWFKVSTDIFLIYALFYSLDKREEVAI